MPDLIAALPEAHIALTAMAGPWKPWACICIDMIVDGIRRRYSERLTCWSRSRSPAWWV